MINSPSINITNCACYSSDQQCWLWHKQKVCSVFPPTLNPWHMFVFFLFFVCNPQAGFKLSIFFRMATFGSLLLINPLSTACNPASFCPMFLIFLQFWLFIQASICGFKSLDYSTWPKHRDKWLTAPWQANRQVLLIHRADGLQIVCTLTLELYIACSAKGYLELWMTSFWFLHTDKAVLCSFGAQALLFFSRNTLSDSSLLYTC